MSAEPSTFQVVMPRLGLTMVEARITEWLKTEGSWVEKGEPLFTLEHEKAALEIESPASGFLHILVAPDNVVPILTPIAELETNQEYSQHPVANEVMLSASPQNYSYPGSSVENIQAVGAKTLRATPKARWLARQQNCSLDHLVGSGPRGMLVAADIRAAMQTKPAVKASPLARNIARQTGVDLSVLNGSGPRGQVVRRDVEKSQSDAIPTHSSTDLDGLAGLRGVIARRLSASWVERPQVTLTTDADATFLEALRQLAEAEWQIKISYNAILIKLAAKALREHPYMNVQLTATGIQVLPDINIGLAVEIERGLIVPVVRNADRKSLFAINQELQDLAQRALEGRSLPDELSGGTFTITNLGMFEIDAFTPIINPPECAILGLGRIISRPVGSEGQIVLKDMVALSLSFDHRLVDGAPAARFLQRVKTLIERCALMGLEP